MIDIAMAKKALFSSRMNWNVDFKGHEYRKPDDDVSGYVFIRSISDGNRF